MSRARDHLSREEIARFTRASDAMGWLAVLGDWAMIAGAFALVAWRANAWTVSLAVVLLGGRQLGLAVLMHEASHGSLFRTRGLNRFVGRWLCGAPTGSDLDRYRVHHLAHHSFTGTARDPDRCLVRPFPTTRAALARKVLRDLSGLTGVKRLVGLLAMDFGFITYTASGDASRVVDPEPWPRRLALGLGRIAPPLLANGALFATLAALGHAELYALWAVAWLTTFSLFLRIRAIGEHACTEASADALRNTRTVRAGPLARLLVAPHGVHFHLEHHLLMTVPYFRLGALHRVLVARGVLDESPVAPGYLSVLRHVTLSRAGG